MRIQSCNAFFAVLLSALITGPLALADEDQSSSYQYPPLCFKYYYGELSVFSKSDSKGTYVLGFADNGRAFYVDSSVPNFPTMAKNAQLALSENKYVYISFNNCSERIIELSLTPGDNHKYIYR